MSIVLNHPLVASLGWAIVHSLWQIALLGVLYAVVRSFLKPQLRYSIGLFTLSLALVAFVTTLSIVYVNYDVPNTIEQQNSDFGLVEDDSNFATEASEPTKAVVSEQVTEDLNLINTTDVVDTSNSLIVENTSFEAVSDLGTDRKIIVETSWSDLPSEVLELYQSDVAVKASMTQWQRFIQPILPWLVGLWFLGVGILSIKLIVQFLGIRRLRRLSKEAIPQSLKDNLKLLKQQLSIKQNVQLRYSDRVTSPMTMGVFHPVIMLPLTTLTGLSDEQLEAILLHELAHIKRHDYLVNVFQCVVETLLFYHPVLWWISGQVRQSRELCCDDIVLKSQNPLVYAKALTTLESIRQDRLRDRLTVAARGGNLLSRIRRLLGQDDDYTPRWLTGVLTLVFVTILGTVTGFYASVNAQSVLDDIKNSVVIRQVEKTEPHMVWVTVLGELEPSDITTLEGQFILEERKNGKYNKVVVTGQNGQLSYKDYEHISYGNYFQTPVSTSKRSPNWFSKVYQQIYLDQIVSKQTKNTISSYGYLEDAELNVYLSYVKLPRITTNNDFIAPIDLSSLSFSEYKENKKDDFENSIKVELVILNHYINHGLLNEIVVLDFYKDVMREFASNNTYDDFFGQLLRGLPSEAMRVQLLSTQIDAVPFWQLYPERNYWESKFNYFDVVSVIYGVESPVYSVVLLEQLMARANEEGIHYINETYPHFWGDIESAIKRLPSEYQESLEGKIDSYRANDAMVESKFELPSSLWVTVSSNSFEYGKFGNDDKFGCRANLTELKGKSFITNNQDGEAVCKFNDVGDSVKIEYRNNEQVEVVDIEIAKAGLEFRYSNNGISLGIEQGQYLIDRVVNMANSDYQPMFTFDNGEFISFHTRAAEEGHYRLGSHVGEVLDKQEAYALIHEAAHDVSSATMERIILSIQVFQTDPEMMSLLLKAASELEAEDAGVKLLTRLFQDTEIPKSIILYPFGEHTMDFQKTFELFNIDTDEAKLLILKGFFEDIVHRQYFEDDESYGTESRGYPYLSQIVEEVVGTIESETSKQEVYAQFNAIKAPRLTSNGDTFLGFARTEPEPNLPVGFSLRHPLVFNQISDELLTGRKLIFVEPPNQLRPSLTNHGPGTNIKTQLQQLGKDVQVLKDFKDDIRVLIRDDVADIYDLTNEITVANLTFPVLTYSDYYVDRIATRIPEPDKFNNFTLSVQQGENHSTFVAEYNWGMPIILCTDNGRVVSSYSTYAVMNFLSTMVNTCLTETLRSEDVALDISDSYASPQFLFEDSKGQQLKPSDLEGNAYAVVLLGDSNWYFQRSRVEMLEAIQEYLRQAKEDIRIIPVLSLPTYTDGQKTDYALELAKLRKSIKESPKLENLDVYEDVLGNSFLHFFNSGRVALFDEKSLLIGSYEHQWKSNFMGREGWHESATDLWEDIRARY